MIDNEYDVYVDYIKDGDREELINEITEDFLKDHPSGGFMFVDGQFEKKV